MKLLRTSTFEGTVIQDPPFAKFLFSDVRLAPVWAVVRVLLGLGWLDAGLHKLNPDWLETGVALQGFWARAVSIPESGRPPIAYDWYRGFIQSLLDSGAYTWFAKLIVFAEIAIGILLIIGAFVGIAAFFGALLNWNFIMAGAASTNAFFALAALFLILAWKTAGYLGADYFLLRKLGTPWGRDTQPENAVNQARATS